MRKSLLPFSGHCCRGMRIGSPFTFSVSGAALVGEDFRKFRGSSLLALPRIPDAYGMYHRKASAVPQTPSPPEPPGE